jgi:hypothetical protein
MTITTVKAMVPPRFVIGIAGPAGSGKGVFARMLAVFLDDSAIVPFAAPLKEMARALGWDGQKDAKGRRLLQLLGTEVGRQCIAEDIWVYRWVRAVSGKTRAVIADDCRFENEANAIHGLGGVVVCLTGRGYADTPTHASEAGLPADCIDVRIENTGSLDQLFTKARLFATELIGNELVAAEMAEMEASSQ